MDELRDLCVNLEPEEVSRKLRLRGQNAVDQAGHLLEIALPLVKPRAVCQVCYVTAREEEGVELDGVRFGSRVLRKNLDGVERAFVFVLTIGRELEERADSSGDILEQYYLDAIANLAVTSVRKSLQSHVSQRFALGNASSMSPGSLSDWPIDAQRPLFSLLGDVESAIGVRLNDSLVMDPRKSLSGILFPTEVTFCSCQLCPRAVCGSRKAPFDEALAREYEISY